MGLDNINEWLTLVANFGVLIGIVFLAVQIQQNTKYLRQGEVNATFEHVSMGRLISMEPEMT